jgi:spore cortex formation protein SpoVR/YcgB (stage V sporulation)
MQDFLTAEVIKDLKIYIYEAQDKGQTIDYIITKDMAEEARKKIISAFSQSMIPRIEVIDGNWGGKGWLNLRHKFDGAPLEETYAKKTMEHIAYLWGRPVTLDSKMSEDGSISWRISPEGWEAGDDASGEENKEEENTATWPMAPPIPLKQTYRQPWSKK